MNLFQLAESDKVLDRYRLLPRLLVIGSLSWLLLLLGQLRAAFNLSPPLRVLAGTDTDLDSIRQTSQFVSLMEETKHLRGQLT